MHDQNIFNSYKKNTCMFDSGEKIAEPYYEDICLKVYRQGHKLELYSYSIHYENLPLQYNVIFKVKKNENFQ